MIRVVRAAGGAAALGLFGCAMVTELLLGEQQLSWPGAMEPVPVSAVAGLLSSAGVLITSWPVLHWSAWRPVVPAWRIDVALLLGSAGVHVALGVVLQSISERAVLWGWLAIAGLALLGLAATGRALGGLAAAGVGVMGLALLPMASGPGIGRLLRVQEWFSPLVRQEAQWFCVGLFALGIACALLRILGRGRHLMASRGSDAGPAAPAPIGSPL